LVSSLIVHLKGVRAEFIAKELKWNKYFVVSSLIGLGMLENYSSSSPPKKKEM